MLYFILLKSIVLEYYLKILHFIFFQFTSCLSGYFWTLNVLSVSLEYGQNLQCVLWPSGNRL
jgi:hypothetical protein